MTSRKQKSAPCQIGYGRPPVHTRFRKGQSGNPGGRPRRAAEHAKVLALREAYRTVAVKERGRVVALPAIQAVLRSQIALAAEGNVQAQRAVLAAIQQIEAENLVDAKVAALAEAAAQHAALLEMQTTEQENANGASNPYKHMSYTEAAQRVLSLLGLDKPARKVANAEEEKGVDGAQSGRDDAPGAAPHAAYPEARSR